MLLCVFVVVVCVQQAIVNQWNQVPLKEEEGGAGEDRGRASADDPEEST